MGRYVRERERERNVMCLDLDLDLDLGLHPLHLVVLNQRRDHDDLQWDEPCPLRSTVFPPSLSSIISKRESFDLPYHLTL